MIETKILGDAVGIQRGDVIDNSETTVLPSLANGVITGHFKRGRMDKPFRVTASNYQALLGYDPSNPSYLAVEDAFKRGISEISVFRVGATGDVIAPPAEVIPPVVVTAQHLSFTTTNPYSETTELAITVVISKEATEWELKESGVLVADSDGFRINGITGVMGEFGYEINLLSAGKNKDYELLTTAEWVRLAHTAVRTGGTADGGVTVTSFTPNISRLYFNLPSINLTVPNELPSYITSLSSMFFGCTLFNQDISGWDTSNITNVRSIFGLCERFNQPIGSWNMSNVTDVGVMFYKCSVFNQAIGGWDMSNVTDMLQMFYYASAFNKDISGWDTSNVTNMDHMFLYASAFSVNLNQWCVGLITAKPTNFWLSTSLSPIWGTCPRGENLVA